MKIRIVKTDYYKGLSHLFSKEHFSIERLWAGKIIHIGLESIYLTLDFRKNWVKDMITGKVE